jgi:hypothetical protein
LSTMVSGMFQQVRRHMRTLTCDNSDRSESSSCTSTSDQYIVPDLG